MPSYSDLSYFSPSGSQVLDARNPDELDPRVLRSHPERISRHPRTFQAFRQTSYFDGKDFKKFRGAAQWLAYLLQDPATLGSIPSFPAIFSKEKIDSAAKVNQ